MFKLIISDNLNILCFSIHENPKMTFLSIDLHEKVGNDFLSGDLREKAVNEKENRKNKLTKMKISKLAAILESAQNQVGTMTREAKILDIKRSYHIRNDSLSWKCFTWSNEDAHDDLQKVANLIYQNC